MKKILIYGFVAAGMLFTTACNEKGLNSVQAGDEANVTFELGLNGNIATKATSVAVADKLVYSLFDAEGNLLEGAFEGGMAVVENAFAAGEETVSVTLVKGQTYSIAFWAQNSACEAYTVTAEADGLKVAVDYNGANNDETRDAYFASQTFTVEDGTEISVVLERPFAQVNLGVTEEDWNAALAAGLNVTESKVVIKNVATSINLLDGSVAGETDVTYEFAAIPTTLTKAATAVKDLEVNDETYKWLSMSYVLTDENKSVSDAVQFTLSTDNGQTIALEEGLTNVPLQRNWRTNVVGNVLTGAVNFNVALDQSYYSAANVTNVEQFEAALADKNTREIILAAGEYDVNQVLKKSCEIKSANPNDPATITGVIAVVAPAKKVIFQDLKFTVSDKSTQATGHKNIDRYERKSIVPIYAAEVSFEGCEFTNLYDERCVVAINYNAHIPGVMLSVDKCKFQGYAYTIYSRSLISVTNSEFNQNHSQVNPRAIFLYGLGDGTEGKVIFQNNKAAGKTSYAIQIMSSNHPYGNVLFDVRENENFAVEGLSYLYKPGTPITPSFVEGSEIFEVVSE